MLEFKNAGALKSSSIDNNNLIISDIDTENSIDTEITETLESECDKPQGINKSVLVHL